MAIQGGVMARMESATKKAFDRVAKVGNIETDPELALYGTLKSEHFTALMKEYGEDAIIGYIKDMEGKKIMGSGRK